MFAQTVEHQHAHILPELSPREKYYQALVHRLYDDFDRATGIKTSQSDRLSRAFHPVLERAKIVMTWMKYGQTSEHAHGLHRDIDNNILTSLSERYNVRGATGYYDIIDNKLWSPDLQNEPFIESIKRGVVLRADLGSKDTLREHAEVTGWEKITKTLLSSPLGTPIISLSPPGDFYKDKYVDTFTRTSTTKVLRERFAVNFTLEDYEAFAQSAHPDYFADYNPSSSEDAYFLGNPFVSPQHISPHHIVGYPVEKFNIIGSYSTKVRADLKFALLEESIDWRKVISANNTLLSYTDTVKQDLEVHALPQINYSSRLSILDLDVLSKKPVQNVVGGCGSTGGFEFAKNTLLKNSAAQSALQEDENYTTGVCKSCDKHGSVGTCSKKCPSCEDREHPDVNFTRNHFSLN